MALNTTIIGGGTDPSILGTINADLIYGRSMADDIFAGKGNDTVWAGSSSDYVDGGDGNDLLHGEAGNDVLVGGAGADTLNGGVGNDTMQGGTGNDVYIVDSVNDVVTEGLNAGIDEVRVGDTGTVAYGIMYEWKYAPAGLYTLGANVENLTYTGQNFFIGTGNGAGNVIKVGSATYAEVYAAAGNDTVLGNDFNSVVFGDEGNDVLSLGGGYDQGFGGSGNDSIDGGAGNDLLMAGTGMDTVMGGDGNDRVLATGVFEPLYYGNGDLFDWYVKADARPTADWNDFAADLLQGGAGADSMLGLAGDTLAGGTHDDFYELVGNSLATVVESSGAGNDQVKVYDGTYYALTANVEGLRFDNSGIGVGAQGVGNSLNNFIIGTEFSDTLQGGLGNDILTGYYGQDLLQGGDGDDLIAGENDWGNNGYGQADTLSGGNGNDTLVGGGGTDLMSGGAGADIFRFYLLDNGAAAGSRDQVQDFQRGLDKLDLSDLGVTLGAAAAADGAWQVLGRDGKVTVLIDVTGDALADMGIEVAFADGLAPALLSATDFIF